MDEAALRRAGRQSYPLVLAGRLEGVLVAVSSRPGQAAPRDDLAPLLDLAAIALRNARLASEREHAAAAARAADERFRALIEHSADGVALLDPAGVFLYASPANQDILGYTPEELLQQDGATYRGSGAFRCRHKEHSWRWIEATATNLLAHPVVGAVVVNYRDVTRQKEAEDARTQLAAIVQCSNDGIASMTLDGRISSWNAAAERLYGRSAAEAIGQLASILVPPGRAGQLAAILHEIARGGSGETLETELPGHDGQAGERPDGQAIAVSISLSPIWDSAGVVMGAAAIIRDISERKQAQRAMEQINQQLREALVRLEAAQTQLIQQERLRALGEMASGIAHDFNNALAPVIGFTELLLTHPEYLLEKEKALEYLTLIYTGAQDACTIVARLREFYRNRDQHEAFGPVRLSHVIDQAIALAQPRWKGQAQAEGRTIVVRTEVDDLPPVAGDEAQLREVLLNLIFNAIDALPQGGTITISCRPAGAPVAGAAAEMEQEGADVASKKSRDQQWVALAVSDTGTGMSPEVQRRCLEPFFTTKGERGSGLGLSMVHGIVRRHGGHLRIESAPSAGTTITLLLPVASQGQAGVEAPAAPPLARPLRVLVVDDEPSARQVMQSYLQTAGHEVIGVSSAQEALAILEVETKEAEAPGFDLLVTDLAMPSMRGDRLAEAAKQRRPGLPVILLAGVSEPAGALDCPAADAILSKPVSLSLFLETVARVVMGARSEDTPRDS